MRKYLAVNPSHNFEPTLVECETGNLCFCEDVEEAISDFLKFFKNHTSENYDDLESAIKYYFKICGRYR